MKKYLLLLMLVLSTCTTLYSQISVKSFEMLDTDLDANTYYPKKDYNGKTCAIIKIFTTQTGFSFDNGSLGIVATEYKPAEIWLYVPEGTMKLKIVHPQLGHISNAETDGYYWFEQGRLKSGCVYKMDLITGSVRTIVEEAKIQTGWLVFNSIPDGADIYLSQNGSEEKHIGTTPMSKKMPYGTYNYRAKKYSYGDEVGLIELNKERITMDLKLVSASGSIKVNSSPSGASVYLNGNDTGKKTPCLLDSVPSGRCDIRLQLTNYAPATRTVTVNNGETSDLLVTLESRFATITINSLPGAVIKVNGAEAGKTTYKENLQEGIYDVEVTLAGHQSATKQIEVVANQPQTITLNPTPVYGTLDVNSNPMGATISINGKSYGDTPTTIENLLVGDYDVEISKTGYEPVKRHVIITKSSPASIDVKLKTAKSATVTKEVTKDSGKQKADQPKKDSKTEPKTSDIAVKPEDKKKEKKEKAEKFFKIGLEGSFNYAKINTHGKTSFGFGLMTRLGRTTSLINGNIGVKYQYSGINKDVSYDFLDYESYNTFKGSAKYNIKANEILLPLIMNFNIKKFYIGLGYEHGFLLGKKESYTPTGSEGFDLDVYNAINEYNGVATGVSLPSRSLLVQAGWLHKHLDVKLIYKCDFANPKSAMSIGLGLGYYF